jgi:outer membrane lipoprotein
MTPGISVRWLTGYVVAALVCSGCAHVISETARKQTDTGVGFAQVIQNPDAFIGVRLIVGGVIVATRNLPEGTEIEVMQKELDSVGNPKSEDFSRGRFVFRDKGYLEAEIYAKGRRVTGAGKIVGSKTEKIGERDYRYPILEAEELYLWEKEAPAYPPYYPWGYPSPFNRYWGYSPYYW